MTGNALVEAREEQRQALERHDVAGANAAYARELEVLRGNQVVPAQSGEQAVEAVYTALDDAKYPMEQVDELRRTWAGSEAENLSLARAYVDDNPGLVSVVERFGIGEPGALALAAEAARAAGYTFTPKGQQPAREPARPVGTGGSAPRSDQNFRDAMRDWQRQIDEAQAENDTIRANALYQQQQDWLRSQGRGGRIVDGRRTA